MILIQKKARNIIYNDNMVNNRNMKKKSVGASLKGFEKVVSHGIPVFPVYLAMPIRIILLLVMFILSLVVEMYDSYGDTFQTYLASQLILVLGMTFFLSDSSCFCKTQTATLDRLAVAVWIAFALYTFISDIFVDKLYRFSNVSILFVFIVMAFVWNAKNINDGLLLREIVIATQCFLFFLVMVSVFSRNMTPDGRFSGPIHNPSIYALYLCSVWAVLIASLEYQLRHGIRKSKLFLTVSELLITLVLILLSQSFTPLLALVIISVIWMLRNTSNILSKALSKKCFAITVIVGILVIVTFAVITSHSESSIGTRLHDKLLAGDITTLLSGRDYYWKAYLRKMNLLGHGKKPYLWDHRILPHNALIGMMYWYGVPSVIPYIVMMIMAVEKSWRFSNTRIKYSSVPFYCITSFIIMSMADNVEQPFVWLPWILCYLMLAPILVMPIEKIETLERIENSNNTTNDDSLLKIKG